MGLNRLAGKEGEDQVIDVVMRLAEESVAAGRAARALQEALRSEAEA